MMWHYTKKIKRKNKSKEKRVLVLDVKVISLKKYTNRRKNKKRKICWITLISHLHSESMNGFIRPAHKYLKKKMFCKFKQTLDSLQ